MPPALRELQAALADHLAGSAGGDIAAWVVGDSIAAAARLAVHRHHVTASLGKVLATTYPTVRALVGDACFDGLAHRFVANVLPDGPVLAEWGAEFAAFIAGHELTLSLPYLSDVACLDWALNRAFHSPLGPRLHAAELAGIAVEHLPSKRISLAPGTTLIDSRFPLDRIWRDAQPGASAEALDPGEGPARLLVMRSADDAAFVPLDAGEAAFVSAIGRGSILEEAAERGFAAETGFDLAAAFARLLTLRVFVAAQ